ncbi:MAG: metalloregulator ArsR/SmtB family transcription factor [Clostridia bacterium]|nr:metalloregulator ArsR/SmtB family transcription factor [Clostridia bacterium]
MEINTKQNIEYAEMLKAMAHPARLCIIKNLIKKGNCTVSYMQTCTGQPQSTLSQHIAKLRALKIITGTRNGKEINYEVTNDLVKSIINILYE